MTPTVDERLGELSNTMPLGALPERPRTANDRLRPPMICRAVFEEMFVLANGDIVCASPDPTGRRVYGNVKSDRIADVFNGPMYAEIRRWQLHAQADSFCPVIGFDCARRVSRPSSMDGAGGRWVRLLEIEPISACNLACPGCPVTSVFGQPQLAARAGQTLALEVMNSVIDQLPELQTLLVYGFGEPFLHKQLVPFLRHVKTTRPDVFVAVSTNGIPLTPKKIEAIAEEALVDKLVFAIDGVEQESYARYRVGGKVSVALGNMSEFARALDRAGTRDRVEVVWQYIPFEWNDGDEEIAAARLIAADLGISIDWLPTHSVGASKTYVVGSQAFAALRGESVRKAGGSAELKLRRSLEHPTDNIYLASITSAASALVVPAGGHLSLGLRVANLSGSAWAKAADGGAVDILEFGNPGAFRLGALLQSKFGRTLQTFWTGPLPEGVRPAGGAASAQLEATCPRPPASIVCSSTSSRKMSAGFTNAGLRRISAP